MVRQKQDLKSLCNESQVVSSFVSPHKPPMPSNANQPSIISTNCTAATAGASNANQLPTFNNNNPAATAGASHQAAHQTPFTSQPFLPQLTRNITAPASDMRNLTVPVQVVPRTFFVPQPPPPQPLRSIPVLEPNFRQNISENRMKSSQITTLQNGYESRIRKLNQEIYHLKSSEQQKLLFVEAECAKLNDVVARKNLEMNDLESKLKKVDDENSVLAQKLETEKSTTNNLHTELVSQTDKNSELLQQLDEAKSISEQLQIDLDNQTSELQNCKDRLKKADEEYYELNFQVNNLEDELDQKEKEMLRVQKLSNNIKVDLDTCRSQLQKAQDDMSRVVEERDCLRADLTTANDNSENYIKQIIKLEQKVQQEKYAKEERLKKNSGGDAEQLKSDLYACRVQLEKAQDDIRRVIEERDRLKVQLKTVNDNSETAMDRISKLDLKLKVERGKYTAEIEKLKQDLAEKTKAELDTCQADMEKAIDDISRVVDERDLLKVELESASANSRELKAELETSKKSIGELTIELEKLKAEFQMPSNLSVKSQTRIVRKLPLNLPGPSSVITAVKRTTVNLNATIVPKSIEDIFQYQPSNPSMLNAQPRNVRKFPLNLPGPNSVITAVKRETVDLNTTIDLTPIDSDDKMRPSSSKKKKKSE